MPVQYGASTRDPRHSSRARDKALAPQCKRYLTTKRPQGIRRGRTLMGEDRAAAVDKRP
jgi:hypothetical protein